MHNEAECSGSFLVVSCIQILGYQDRGGGYSIQMEKEDHDDDNKDDNDPPYWQQDGKRICKARGMIRKRAEMPGRQCQCWAFEWEGCEIKVTCKYHLPVECM